MLKHFRRKRLLQAAADFGFHFRVGLSM